MKNLITLLLLVLISFSTNAFAQESASEKPKEPEKKVETPKGNVSDKVTPPKDPNGFIVRFPSRNQPPYPMEKVADVTSIALAANTQDLLRKENSNRLEIFTEVRNPANELLTYNYTVSAGRVIGSGEQVVWDLSGVKAGKYYISAAVDEGCGFCGKTFTRWVVVGECSECESKRKITFCPAFKVNPDRSSTREGETIVFSLTSIDSTPLDFVPKYEWKTSAGEILSGQNTPSLTLRTVMTERGWIYVSVDLKSDDPNCPQVYSKGIKIQPPQK